VERSRGWQLGGFDASRRLSGPADAANRAESGVDVLILPYWFLCVLTALLPLQWLRRRRLRRRGARGLCARCGYDLRATPGGARNAERRPRFREVGGVGAGGR